MGGAAGATAGTMAVAPAMQAVSCKNLACSAHPPAADTRQSTLHLQAARVLHSSSNTGEAHALPACPTVQRFPSCSVGGTHALQATTQAPPDHARLAVRAATALQRAASTCSG
ncbi:hypothetical protein ABPG77_000813 [Micractinium sp. CCAP 211/92]